MSSLRGRIALVFLTFALATLLAVSGVLWVALRDLHRDAALGSLAELSVPYATRASQRVPVDVLRRLAPGESRDPDLIRRFRDSQQGRRNLDRIAAFIREAQEEIDRAGVSVLIVQDGGTQLTDTVTGQVVFRDESPIVDVPTRRGDVEIGATTIEGMGAVLYAATPVYDRRPDRVIPALVLVRPDDSARLATNDLVRALLVAGLVLLVIGVPLAWGLSRSVTRPLRRLAAASDTVARGDVPDPLPTSGPTEVAHASSAFNAMAAEVTDTREAQRRFLADARHDLRTPLTVIGGFAQALHDGTASGPAADRAAVAISDETARLERMLADLDHLSIGGDEGPRLAVERQDLRVVATSAVERFTAEADANGLRIDSILDGAELRVDADRDALDRVLGNLVENAFAHARRPDGRVTVEATAVAPDAPPIGGPGGWSGAPGAILAVRDDGAGIPPDALPHVFDRFFRGDPSRHLPGSGLGLAIVRDLAEAHGGRAFAEVPAEGGARVGIVLPRVGVRSPAA